MLADALGIQKLAAVIGGSLGGMQAMQWAIDRPERVGHALLIACASRLSAQNIAFNEIARQAILSDPDFHGGRYLETRHQSGPRTEARPDARARDVSVRRRDAPQIRTRSEIRRPAAGRDVQFQVESYLHHQGRSFSQRFDANTYLLMTRALDHFDPAREYGDDLVAALSAPSATSSWCRSRPTGVSRRSDPRKSSTP